MIKYLYNKKERLLICMGKIIVHDFYCTKCGSKGINVPRIKGKLREPGHLKKLFCLKCQEEVNHVETTDNGKYTYYDFLIEFNNNSFNDSYSKSTSKNYKYIKCY